MTGAKPRAQFIHRQQTRGRHKTARQRTHLLFAAGHIARHLSPAVLKDRKTLIDALNVSISRPGSFGAGRPSTDFLRRSSCRRVAALQEPAPVTSKTSSGVRIGYVALEKKRSPRGNDARDRAQESRLPAPLLPTIVTISPARTSRSSSKSTGTAHSRPGIARCAEVVRSYAPLAQVCFHTAGSRRPRRHRPPRSSTVMQHQNTVGELADSPHNVFHHENTHTPSANLPDDLDHLIDLNRVEAGHDLVEQKEFRPHCKRLGELEPLWIGPTKGIGALVDMAVEPSEIEPFACGLRAFSPETVPPLPKSAPTATFSSTERPEMASSPEMYGRCLGGHGGMAAFRRCARSRTIPPPRRVRARH